MSHRGFRVVRIANGLQDGAGLTSQNICAVNQARMMTRMVGGMGDETCQSAVGAMLEKT